MFSLKAVKYISDRTHYVGIVDFVLVTQDLVLNGDLNNVLEKKLNSF